jgi:hypothetical protein
MNIIASVVALDAAWTMLSKVLPTAKHCYVVARVRSARHKPTDGNLFFGNLLAV